MIPRPKYALAERERRWLVSPAVAAPLCRGTCSVIRDRYLDASRLRLRRVQAPDGGVVYKLCRKYADQPAGAESIANLYLCELEFELLASLPGWVVEKQRYRHAGGSLDRYPADPAALFVYEREFPDAESQAAFADPAFVLREITGAAGFSGAELARRFGHHEPDRTGGV